jgi:hypothetical protein
MKSLKKKNKRSKNHGIRTVLFDIEMVENGSIKEQIRSTPFQF